MQYYRQMAAISGGACLLCYEYRDHGASKSLAHVGKAGQR